MKSLAVFCGSSAGHDPVYAQTARHVGRTLAERGITVVYGGGRAGLMGALADAALEAGGDVVGVIPHALHERELTHTGVSRLHVVDSMHERKTVMADAAEAFLALPGGVGTIEEITEQWTWAQLSIHAKPCGFLDVADYWAPMRAMTDRMVDAGFLRASQRDIAAFDDDLDRLLRRLQDPPAWEGLDAKAAPSP